MSQSFAEGQPSSEEQAGFDPVIKVLIDMLADESKNFFPYEELELPCLIEVLMTGKAPKQEKKVDSPMPKIIEQPLAAEEFPKVNIPSEDLPKIL
jgi:hypothetical protein